MVLIRNFNTNTEKASMLQKSLQSLALEIENSKRIMRDRTVDYDDVKAIQPAESKLFIDETAAIKLQSKEKREEEAKKNLMKLTDAINANKIISELNDKNPLFIKYLNMIFPKLETKLKREYKNITAQFFVNYAIEEIEKAYENELNGEDDDDEFKELLEERKIRKGLKLPSESSVDAVEPEELDEPVEEKQAFKALLELDENKFDDDKELEEYNDFKPYFLKLMINTLNDNAEKDEEDLLNFTSQSMREEISTTYLIQGNNEKLEAYFNRNLIYEAIKFLKSGQLPKIDSDKLEIEFERINEARNERDEKIEKSKEAAPAP
jgi:hypothetical protein